MPRILNTKICPHCKGALDAPTPRVCPHCGGSLQQRFFTAGCLSSAPPVILLALGVAWLARATSSERAAPDAGSERSVGADAHERIAKPAARP